MQIHKVSLGNQQFLNTNHEVKQLFCHLFDAIRERINEKRNNIRTQFLHPETKQNLKFVLTENLSEGCLMLSSGTSVQDHIKNIQYPIVQLCSHMSPLSTELYYHITVAGYLFFTFKQTTKYVAFL